MRRKRVSRLLVPTSGSIVALAASLSAATLPAWAGNGCVASFGAADGYGPNSCSYVAGGPGRYAAVLNAGGFEIRVDGEIAVWGWGPGAKRSGEIASAAGQTVVVTVECDRGSYCAASGANGAVAAGDR